MATTCGKPSLSMVARAAFLRSRKNATCSSGLSRICCRRSVAIRACLLSRAHQPAPLSILSSNGQVSRQEALGLVEAPLRRILSIAGVGAHGKAVAGAVVDHEGADLAEGQTESQVGASFRSRELCGSLGLTRNQPQAKTGRLRNEGTRV